MNAQGILAGLQVINTIMRMMDRTGRDPVIRAIVAKHVNGDINEVEALEAITGHMRQRGQAVMTEWRGSGPQQG